MLQQIDDEIVFWLSWLRHGYPPITVVFKSLVYFQALPHEQVMAVHIDNGFMRKNESQAVEESLKRLGLRLKGNSAEGDCEYFNTRKSHRKL